MVCARPILKTRLALARTQSWHWRYGLRSNVLITAHRWRWQSGHSVQRYFRPPTMPRSEARQMSPMSGILSSQYPLDVIQVARTPDRDHMRMPRLVLGPGVIQSVKPFLLMGLDLSLLGL